MIIVPQPVEFEWDKGNIDKNWQRHKVLNQECEEAFFDRNKKILKDPPHSALEKRFILIGKTKKDRWLFIVFVIRRKKIRIISARNLNKRERSLYGK